MKTSHITFSVCFVFIIMMQFFLNTELLPAQNIPSDDKTAVNSTSVKSQKSSLKTRTLISAKFIKARRLNMYLSWKTRAMTHWKSKK